MSEHHLENVNLNQGLGLPGLKEVCSSADVQALLSVISYGLT